MPYRDPQKEKEYREEYRNRPENKEIKKEYNRKYREKYRDKLNADGRNTSKIKRDKRRKILIERLGGKCVKCGSTENHQFDHIDPKTKKDRTYCVSTMLTRSMERLIVEADKCQLLCSKCHLEKTYTEECWKDWPRGELGYFIRGQHTS